MSSDKSSTLSKGRALPFPLVSFALGLPLGRPRPGFPAVVVVDFRPLVGAVGLDGERFARVAVFVVFVSAVTLAFLDRSFI